jgi:1-acyl-sn-glycerol-3-phosphate acyltransferase
MNLPIPPKWVRRLLIAPAMVYLGLWLLLAALPLWLVIVLVLSFAVPGKLRPLRLGGFLLVYFAIEVVGLMAAFVLWLATGFGYAMKKPWSIDAHYRLLKILLGTLFWFGVRFFELTVVAAGPVLPAYDRSGGNKQRPLIVMSRHAGPGDSFLLVHELLSWEGRRPRIVLKDTLQLDPLMDVMLNRLPAQFVDPTSGEQDATMKAIHELSATMTDADALVIFPEGGNVTEKRRIKAIERLRASGREEAAIRAEGIKNLMPPRPAGVGQALRANSRADAVVIAHTGLDTLVTARDLWRELPLAKTLKMGWAVFPAGTVPTDPGPLSDWLFDRWEEMDAWVDQGGPAD